MEKINNFPLILDTSPISSSPLNAQTPWHGNIETSTDTLTGDTLVPEMYQEQICSELSSAENSNAKELLSSENDVEQCVDRFRSRVWPELPSKSKTLPNGCSASLAMDDSIFIQPEQQRMEISNGNRYDSNQFVSTAPVPNGTMPLYRRRRNSFNSKPPPPIVDTASINANVRSDSISPNAMNSKFILPNNITRTLSATQPTSIRMMNTPSQVTTNISMISCPDGLAHALSEQNLRLQQIVHEHKVS